ncbi:MAG: hypothetical protein CMJ18_06015 [Phycisphaeraceae bacterium]|nr:hypothetical protein [Phycisphaeraceae bacterium]
MVLFWKKERQVEQVLDEYLGQAADCVRTFVLAIDAYLDDGINERFEQLLEQTHHYESEADDKRRQIERTMYRRELIPESRGDILGVLEALDLIPNRCESVLYQIWTQSIIFPAQFAVDLKEMVRINAESTSVLFDTVRLLFRGTDKVDDGARHVDDLEGQSDRLERQMIRSIFQSDVDKVDMLLLKELVLEIGAISDRAENAADRLSNIAVKRSG